MDSALINFLKKDYPSHFGIPWNDNMMKVRREECAKRKFEIRDKNKTIIQYKNNGVSIINNTRPLNVEIIDFEHYINLYGDSSAGSGRKCDFIINPVAGYDFIIFNELTESKNDYILPFVSPISGENKEGKQAYAKKQLEISIEKFYTVNNFLDSYQKKIALFSCRLSDGKPNDVMTTSMKTFRKPQKIVSNIRSDEPMTHGFVFEQRIYDEEYKVI